MNAALPWGDFTEDPRRPEAAGLRAGDRDRDVVLGVLSEGYAEGRLTREEYDQRAEATAAARTLGDLPALILDLVPQGPPLGASTDLALTSSDDLRGRAVERWQSQRRHALSSALIPSLICWVIWVATGFGQGGGFDAQFPWPLFVMLGTGANLVRVLLHREDIIAEEQRRLEKKQRKALERPRRPGEQTD